MANNPFDSFAKDLGNEPKSNNPFDAWAGNLAAEDEAAKPLSNSLNVAVERDPNRWAEVVKLSQELKLPTSFVEPEFDTLYKKRSEYLRDPRILKMDYPKAANFLENPDNASVAQDDVDSITGLEKEVGIYDTFANNAKLFGRGVVGTAESILVGGPIAAFQLGSSNLNALISLGQQAGFDIEQLAVPDVLKDSPIKPIFENAREWYTRELKAVEDVSFTEVFNRLGEGDLGFAGRNLFYKFSETAPNTLAIIAATLATGGAATPTALGFALGAGSAAQQGVESEATPLQQSINTGIAGASEAAFEYLGTVLPIKSFGKNLVRQFGKSGAVEVGKEFFNTALKSFGAEAATEAATEATQLLSEWMTDVNPNALEDFFANVAGAGLLGGFAGGVFTSPAAIAQAVRTRKLVEEANEARVAYEKIGTISEKSKLRERLPESFERLVEQVTDGTTVQTVYMPIEDVEAYFQEREIKPVEFFEQIGARKEYEMAKETGTDIAVPFSKWATRVVGTEHYYALKNDIKFDQSFDTARQAERASKEQALEGEIVKAEAEMIPETPKELIEREIREAAVNAGVPVMAAKRFGEAQADLFEREALGVGQDLKEFYEANKFQITDQLTPEQVRGGYFQERLPSPYVQKEKGPTGFYSQLKRAASDLKFTKEQPKQLLTRLEKVPGVKKSEIEWSGLKEWLSLKEGPVTKEEVTAFLENNGVAIEQVLLGETSGGQTDLVWGEERPLSRSQWDPDGSLFDEEVRELLNDSYYTKEIREEARAELVKEFTDEQGNVDEAGLEEAINARLQELVEESVNLQFDSGDSIYQEFQVEEENTGWEIRYRMDGGDYWVIDDSGSYRESFGSLEEAKIQAALIMQRAGVLEEGLRPIAEGDIVWSNLVSEEYSPTQEEVVEQIKNNKARYTAKAKEEINSSFEPPKPNSKEWKKRILQYVERYARRALTSKHSSPTNPETKFTIRTENPFFKIALVGSVKDGFNLSVLNQRGLSTKIEAKNVRVAQAKAIEYMREKGFVDAEPRERPTSPNIVEGASQYGQYTTDQGTNYRELLLTLPSSKSAFTRGHWRNKNILAHARIKERISEAGERVLFVEEIQSDWKQQSKKFGTTEQENTALRKELGDRQEAIDKELDDLADKLLPIAKGLGLSREDALTNRKAIPAFLINEMIDNDIEDATKYVDLTAELIEIERTLNRWEGPVPPAPFDESKEWGALVFKRLLSYAVEEGFDAIAWTSGAVQANRYGDSESAKKGRDKFYDEVLPSAFSEAVKTIDKKLKAELVSSSLLTGGISEDGTQYPEFFQAKLSEEVKEKIASQGFPLFQDRGEPLGATFQNESQVYIALFQNWNESTLWHESAHAHLIRLQGQYGQLVSRETLNDEQRSYKKTLEDLLEWLGVQSFEEIKREHHEKFADGFEAYLMEGKAPKKSLRTVFRALKDKLLAIYRTIRGRPTISPEAAEIFDRLLATDEEIRANKADPLVEDPLSAGLTEAQAKRYIQLSRDAEEEAKEAVEQELLEDVKRKQAADYKRFKKEAKDRIREELKNDPVFKIYEALKTGKLSDGQPFSISREAAIKAYGREFTRNLARGVLSKEGVYTADEVAATYGFESGKELLNNYVNFRPLEQTAETLAEQEMQRRFPELLGNPKLSEEVKSSLHSDSYSDRLILEMEIIQDRAPGLMKMLLRRIMRRMPTTAAIKLKAQEILADMNVSSVRPRTFELAEQRFRKQAGDAFIKGDFKTAFELKQKEALNFHLYKQALEIQGLFDDSRKRFMKVNGADENLAKSRDMDLVSAARALLAVHGIRDGEANIDKYLGRIKQYDPETYGTLINYVNQIPTSGPMTVSRFVQVREAFDALWAQSKEMKTLEIEGQKLNQQMAMAEMAEQLGNFEPAEVAALSREPNAKDEAKSFAKSLWAFTKRVEAVVSKLDAGNINGPFRKYIWQPISDGVVNYRLAKKQKRAEFLALLKEVKGRLSNEPIVATELNFTFTNKAHLLGALLHTGNKSNLRKLLVGRRWGEVNEETGELNTARWDSFLARMYAEGVLTKEDWDFTQKTWDLFESLKPAAQATHKKLYGHYFNEVTADEVITPFGNYRGGYAPAMADTRASNDAAIRDEKELLEKFNNSFMFPTSGRGFTKNRVDAYAAPLVLDLGLVGGHLDKVLRFIHIEPAVKNVSRMLWNKNFRALLDAYDPDLTNTVLIPWLQRAAQQRVMTPGNSKLGRQMDRIFQTARIRASFNIMTLNIPNTLQQLTGLSVAAAKVQPRHIRNGLFSYVKAPRETHRFIISKSAWMETRLDDSMRDINDKTEALLLRPSKFETVQQWSEKNAYILQQMTQNMVDQSVWLGAYNQGLESGLVEGAAIKAADSAVRETQGSFSAEDVSRIETGPSFLRLFNMFVSYFNMQLNLLASEGGTAIDEIGMKKAAPRLFYLALVGFMLPAFLSELITKTMRGELDEDDDDDYLDDLMQAFFAGTAKNAIAMVPFAGPLANAVKNRMDDKFYNDQISVSPVISQLESLLAPVSVAEAAFGEGSEKKAVRDSLTLIGLLTGIPVTPLGRPIGYLIDVEKGKAKPQNELDYFRGLVTGAPGVK